MAKTDPEISLVIPCFNEEKRLPERLTPYLKRLGEQLSDYEVVLVNDGSTDNTLAVLKELAAVNSKIRILNSTRNRGRGFGMKTGVLAARGKYILETDADLPVAPEYIIRFRDFLAFHPEYDFVIGSRGHKDSTFVTAQPRLRVFAGKVFHWLFSVFFGSQFNDVMCGFKMFRREVAKDIFKYIYDEKFLAAGEIIFVANKFGYRVRDLPVAWEDDRRSKVRILRDTFRTIGGLFRLKIRDWQEKYERR